MAKSIISEGKTTNEAIEKGLKQLNVSKKMVDIKVLESEDKRSFFSILAPRVVKVEMTLKEKEEEETQTKQIKQANKKNHDPGVLSCSIFGVTLIYSNTNTIKIIPS